MADFDRRSRSIAAVVYDDVDPERHPIARRSLWAHLRKLADDSMVAADDVDDVDGVWRWRGPGPA